MSNAAIQLIAVSPELVGCKVLPGGGTWKRRCADHCAESMKVARRSKSFIQVFGHK